MKHIRYGTKSFMEISYTNNGKIAYVKTENNWNEWNPTGTQIWKIENGDST